MTVMHCRTVGRGSPAGSRAFARRPGKDIASKQVFLLSHPFLLQLSSVIIVISIIVTNKMLITLQYL